MWPLYCALFFEERKLTLCDVLKVLKPRSRWPNGSRLRPPVKCCAQVLVNGTCCKARILNAGGLSAELPLCIKRTSIVLSSAFRLPVKATPPRYKPLTHRLNHASYKRTSFPQTPHTDDPRRQRLPDAPFQIIPLRLRRGGSRAPIRFPRSPC